MNNQPGTSSMLCVVVVLKRHGDGGGVVVQLGFRRKEKIWMCVRQRDRCKRKYGCVWWRVKGGEGAATPDRRTDPAGGWWSRGGMLRVISPGECSARSRDAAAHPALLSGAQDQKQEVSERDPKIAG